MIDGTDKLNGAVIQSVKLLTDDDVTVWKGEYGAYELIVTTDKGVLRFAGCHDSGAEISVIDGRLTQNEQI